MRKFAAIAAISAAAAFGGLAMAGTANAESVANTETVEAAAQKGIIKQMTTGYEHASNRSTPTIWSLMPNTQVNVLCFTEGQIVNGNPYWVRIEHNGKTGYVHRDAIWPGPTTPPHC